MSHKKGFTLLEILLVVGIIAVLAGIVIVAINPSKQLATVRDTQRKANLAEINKAIQQYYIDHSYFPTAIPSNLEEICDTGTATTSSGAYCTGLIDLYELVPTYLVAIPSDPRPVSLLEKLILTAYASTHGTTYYVMKDTNNKIAMSAPSAENGPITIGEPVPCSDTITEWSATADSSWAGAINACKSRGSCWRLPTKSELEAGLIDQYVNYGNNPGGFQSYMDGVQYWSINDDFNSTYAWTVYAISNGMGQIIWSTGTEFDPKNVSDVPYRCVR